MAKKPNPIFINSISVQEIKTTLQIMQIFQQRLVSVVTSLRTFCKVSYQQSQFNRIISKLLLFQYIFSPFTPLSLSEITLINYTWAKYSTSSDFQYFRPTLTLMFTVLCLYYREIQLTVSLAC